MEDTRVGCPGIVLEGKGMVGRGWGCTGSQVRRSPLKHLVFVMRPWGAVVQMLVMNGRRTDEAWRQENVKSSHVLAEEGLGPLNPGKEDKGRRTRGEPLIKGGSEAGGWGRSAVSENRMKNDRIGSNWVTGCTAKGSPGGSVVKEPTC